MQKGKDLYRGRVRRLRAPVAGLLVLAASCPARAGFFRIPGGAAEVLPAPGGYPPAVDGAGTVSLSAAFYRRDLYLIPGLVETAAGLDCSSGPWRLAFSWRRRGHRLCDEDTHSAVLSVAQDGCLPGLHIETVSRRAAPEGFEDEWSGRIDAGLSICRAGAGYAAASVTLAVFRTGMRGIARGPDGDGGWSAAAGIWNDGAAAEISLKRCMTGTSMRIRLSLPLGTVASLRLGYGFDNGELLCGLTVTRGRWALDLSWSLHPVLGTSPGAGMGVSVL